MTKLPTKLSRKAVIQSFDKLSPVTWEKIFEREDTNGIGKTRTDGDYKNKAYYETEGLILWLVRNGHYSIHQINASFSPPQQQRATVIRTHLLAG